MKGAMDCQCDRPSAGEGEGGRASLASSGDGTAMGETHLTKRARHRRLVL